MFAHCRFCVILYSRLSFLFYNTSLCFVMCVSVQYDEMTALSCKHVAHQRKKAFLRDVFRPEKCFFFRYPIRWKSELSSDRPSFANEEDRSYRSDRHSGRQRCGRCGSARIHRFFRPDIIAVRHRIFSLLCQSQRSAGTCQCIRCRCI